MTRPLVRIIVFLSILRAGVESGIAQNAPTTEPLSTQFQVSVDGKSVPVYLARVCNLSAEQRRAVKLPLRENTLETSFASFDQVLTTQRVPPLMHITISCHDPVRSVKVLPTSRTIAPTATGNTITFTVEQPGALVIEVNGDWVQSLQLFVNPPELNVPTPTDPNVIYFGPGVHTIETLTARDNQTIYLAPGAFVYGLPTGNMPKRPVIALKGTNVTLRGRGVIDGSLCPRGTRSILSAGGTNVRVEGVILRDSSSWTFPMSSLHGAMIDNVKIFGCQGNSDGIDICNSQHVEVKNCYLRTFDDLVVLKTNKGQGEERDVRVHDCVLWNEFAHALSLGAELREPLSDIHFSDCDIIHDKGREWALRVYNCDSAAVSNVTWDNIRIEECRRLMSLWIGKAIWSKEPERGHIADITFRNITSVAPEVPDSNAVLTGFDATHAIDRVQFDHVTDAGNPLTPADVKQNAFVSGVNVTP